MARRPRILVIGAGGFVGRHLCAALASGDYGEADVIATGRDHGDAEHVLDLADTDGLAAAMRRFDPSHVVNLAGISAPMQARENPGMAWHLHAIAPEALGRVLGEVSPEAWLLHVGSGMVYGRAALSGEALSEDATLMPMDVYGVTKAAGDLALGALAEEGVKTMRLRPFNHTGPGQSEDFALPAFAMQIARIEAGLNEPGLFVGNLDAERDFLDVVDVVDAYCRLILHAPAVEPGAVFNVASGTGHRIGDLLDMMIEASDRKIEIVSDPERQRPSNIPRMVGKSDALTNATGWTPRMNAADIVRRVLEDCRTRVKGAERSTL